MVEACPSGCQMNRASAFFRAPDAWLGLPLRRSRPSRSRGDSIRYRTGHARRCRAADSSWWIWAARPTRRRRIQAGRRYARRLPLSPCRVGAARCCLRVRLSRSLACEHQRRPRCRQPARLSCNRPDEVARRVAAGRSLPHESDHPGTPGGVIGFDGRRVRSCWRDGCRASSKAITVRPTMTGVVVGPFRPQSHPVVPRSREAVSASLWAAGPRVDGKSLERCRWEFRGGDELEL
jgi:hypothetical protein